MKPASVIRLDHRIIYEVIEPETRVLDLGCGTGDLLSLLAEGKNVKGQGIELEDRAIHECVKKGINAFHSDIESGLKEYPDRVFDYVILNQSMQEVKQVDSSKTTHPLARLMKTSPSIRCPFHHQHRLGLFFYFTSR